MSLEQVAFAFRFGRRFKPRFGEHGVRSNAGLGNPAVVAVVVLVGAPPHRHRSQTKHPIHPKQHLGQAARLQNGPMHVVVVDHERARHHRGHAQAAHAFHPPGRQHDHPYDAGHQQQPSRPHKSPALDHVLLGEGHRLLEQFRRCMLHGWANSGFMGLPLLYSNLKWEYMAENMCFSERYSTPCLAATRMRILVSAG